MPRNRLFRAQGSFPNSLSFSSSVASGERQRLGRRRLTRFPHVARGLTCQRCVAAAEPETAERDLIGAWQLPRVRPVRSSVALLPLYLFRRRKHPVIEAS